MREPDRLADNESNGFSAQAAEARGNVDDRQQQNVVTVTAPTTSIPGIVGGGNVLIVATSHPSIEPQPQTVPTVDLSPIR